MYELGRAYAANDQPADALAHYEAALKLDPDFPEAHANLALALSRLGRTGEALAHCRTALQLKPGYSDAQKLLEQLAGAGGK
jgi:tetratricopeptide (TPR) repeat protein